MKRADKRDLTIFKNIAQSTQDQLLKSLTKILKAKYGDSKVIMTPDYILCEGELPIMLVAHLDTVFLNPPRNIYFDQELQVMWSPQGLGADDRAGIFSILKIIKKGYKPSICFCTDEEKGSNGAAFLVQDYPKCPFELKYIIELDRQGSNDCVFYSCSNDAFEAYVESFGFVTDWGTFSDISEICPKWKIAGVNLSIGYYNEHSIGETLHFNQMYATINRVMKMLDEVDSSPYFEYKEDPLFGHIGRWGLGYPIDEWEHCESKIICTHCKRAVPFDDAVKVKDKDIPGVSSYYCVDCLTASDDIDFCLLCGDPFVKKYDTDKVCISCKKHFPEVSLVNDRSESNKT